MSAAPTPVERDALARARELALNGRGRVSPNPLVGAVVLSPRGRTVAEGWHEGPGEEHAEAMALRLAGDEARGATVVCTLEPCSHWGRTPPCANALIEAGVARVVVGALDPLERDRARGADVLRGAGIDVALASGDDERACRALNAPFLTHALLGRPHVTLKLAASLDGRVATSAGESRWITGEPARALVHRWRADHDAVMVGVNTAVTDDPLLTARGLDGPVRQPVRVVVDSRGRLPLESALVRGAGGATVVVATAQDAPAAAVAALQERGVRVVAAGAGRVDLPATLRILAEMGLQSVFVEGGGVLAGALLRAGVVDDLRWFAAPLVLGDDARPAVAGVGWPRLADAPRPSGATIEAVGDDALITGRLTPLPGEV
ncbi:MAG: bifunctional diaminohydroxyphosphoribosylaminopyrimidine deaminase/5-amino-6-(5-phosphoribosylamino)uracil reductase RibD [Thermoleophilia bacterium]|nr:bifunctional diaminohydroxyphosphoribosylaminopyrimidine deaminase/5-amino-6-(5-phosphoribosylamino)uracil reductase RibD [Thermoleophilia bacterium]